MSAARPLLVWAAALAALLLSGCGYVHFGRHAPATVTGDAIVTAENSSLRLEKKMLQQELDLARKEGAALRAALENRYSDTGSGQTELVARLNETTRELAALRANYAKLEAERRRALTDPTAGNGADLQGRLGDTEEKLAAAMLTYTQLQQETNFLRSEVNRVRGENTQLTRKVGELTARNEQAVAVLSQLNSELLAQREARNRAEQETRAVRAQLQMIVNRTPRADATTLADARTGSAVETAEMNAPVHSDSPAPASAPAQPNATLRSGPDRPRAAAARPATESGPRYHLVAEGDTLEGIAMKYYGKPERWRVIYATNNTLLRDGRPLAPGMKLEIPAE